MNKTSSTKRLLINALFFLLVVIIGFSEEKPLRQASYPDPEYIYNHWHETIRSHGRFDSPMLFSAYGSTEMTNIISQINSNKASLTFFMCAKLVEATNYDDMAILFLDRVSGINLWFSDRIVGDAGKNTKELVDRFRIEWREGIYKDPSKKIADLCKERITKEATNIIDPHEVAALRRYGVFGMPELVRQIKKNNSKHAFAAYLIITWSDEYADYLNQSDKQFTSPESKLEHVRAKVEKMKTHEGGASFEITKRISSALSE